MLDARPDEILLKCSHVDVAKRYHTQTETGN